MLLSPEKNKKKTNTQVESVPWCDATVFGRVIKPWFSISTVFLFLSLPPHKHFCVLSVYLSLLVSVCMVLLERCLSDGVQFVAAAYRTISVSPENLFSDKQ